MRNPVPALRTPDERFSGLPAFDFAPRYLDGLPGFGTLRVHYLDERLATTSGRTVLCLHGQPTWCFLFRKMIPVFMAAGHRVVARQAAQFFRERWEGQAFMAIGMQDPVLGPPVMRALAKTIRGCPAPLELAEAGHFVQEWGREVAEQALIHFGDLR